MPQARKRQTYTEADYPDENSVRIHKLPINLEMADRLRQARIAAGYPRPIDAARAFGWPLSTYWSNENGSRGFSDARQLEYATSFRVSIDWLAFGRGEMRGTRRRIPIEGYVTQLAKIQAIEDHIGTGSEVDDVEMPPGSTEDLVAYRVTGDTNYPAFRDRDVLFVPRTQSPPEAFVGQECVVKTITGDRLIRTLLLGSHAGVYALVGFNTPPLADVEISEARPIRWIKRGD
jgi:phage repressor protein C with HTH and peptisase S24 domain